MISHQFPPRETTCKGSFVLRDFDASFNSRSSSQHTSKSRLNIERRIKCPSRSMPKATNFGGDKKRSDMLVTRYLGEPNPPEHGSLRKGGSVRRHSLGIWGKTSSAVRALHGLQRKPGCLVLSTWVRVPRLPHGLPSCVPVCLTV